MMACRSSRGTGALGAVSWILWSAGGTPFDWSRTRIATISPPASTPSGTTAQDRSRLYTTIPDQWRGSALHHLVAISTVEYYK